MLQNSSDDQLNDRIIKDSLTSNADLLGQLDDAGLTSAEKEWVIGKSVEAIKNEIDMQELSRFRADNAIVQNPTNDFLTLWAGFWVAVLGGEVVAFADTVEALFERNFDKQRSAVKFIHR